MKKAIVISVLLLAVAPAFAGTKIYVGNLSYTMTDADLESLFAQYGTVESAQIMVDRGTGRSKGFGFVEMETPQEAEAAIRALHEAEVNGRRLTVNLSRPREDRRLSGVNGH